MEVQKKLGGLWRNPKISSIITEELWKDGVFQNQCAKMLDVFKTYGWVSTDVFSNMFKQYNARIVELRKGLYDGNKYLIYSERREGVFGFDYRGKEK